MQNCDFLPAFRGNDADGRQVSGDGGSGIDLFGTGEGYRPGRNTYTINGLPATESQFMMEIESGHIGGTFGLIEMAARMSNREIGRWYRTGTYDPDDTGDGTAENPHKAGSTYRQLLSIVYDESWTVLRLIVPYTQPQNKSVPSTSQPPSRISDKNIREFFDKFPRCFMVLQKVLGNRFNDFLKSLNQMEVVDVRKNPGLLDESSSGLGITMINDDGSLSPLLGTLGDFASNNAIAAPLTNTAYLFSSFFDKSSVERGAIKLHEQFHIFFRANHSILVRQVFQIQPLPDMEVTFASPPFVIPSIALDGNALSGWLSRGCTDQ